MGELPVPTIVGLGGLVIGLGFGAVTRWGDFCVLGSLADITVYGDYRRLRAWLMAVATALFGVHALHGLGAIDLKGSIYLGSVLGWNGAIIGGLMFGYGHGDGARLRRTDTDPCRRRRSALVDRADLPGAFRLHDLAWPDRHVARMDGAPDRRRPWIVRRRLLRGCGRSWRRSVDGTRRWRASWAPR